MLLRIEWMDFINDRVGVRNVSTETIDFDDTWAICINYATCWDLGAARDLAPGERLRIRLAESGT